MKHYITTFFLLLSVHTHSMYVSRNHTIFGSWEKKIRNKQQNGETLFASLPINNWIDAVCVESLQEETFWQITITLAKKLNIIKRLILQSSCFKKPNQPNFYEEKLETFSLLYKEQNKTQTFFLRCNQNKKNSHGLLEVRNNTTSISFTKKGILFSIKEGNKANSEKDFVSFCMPGLQIEGYIPEPEK